MATQDEVAALYQSVLGRQADTSGLAAWTNSGKSADEIAQAFKSSAEYQKKASATAQQQGVTRANQHQGSNPYSGSTASTNSVRDQVANIYRTELGREADAGGIDAWTKWGEEKGIDSAREGIRGTAEYQGYNSYRQHEASLPENSPPVGTAAVSPQTETVQGQLQGLLNNENPLMQASYQKGLELANSRGILNSSMAAEAGQTAMLNAALPIAQQDSSTYFNNRTNALNRQHDYNMQQSQQGFQRSQLDNEVYANFRGQLTTAIQDLTKTTSINITEIQTSPNISAEDKATMIAQQQDLLQSLTNNISGLYSEAEIWQQGWATYMSEAN